LFTAAAQSSQLFTDAAMRDPVGTELVAPRVDAANPPIPETRRATGNAAERALRSRVYD
jgi:hypothetical protein